MPKFCKKFFLMLFCGGILSLFFFIYPSFILAAGLTYVSGTISTTTTWALSNSPYIVIGNITINSGVMLSIDPGVEVKFDGNYSITVDGILSAQGTADNKIKFTSNKESPLPGDWDRIYFRNGSNSSVINYTEIEYGGSLNGATIYIETSSPTINHCEISSSSSYPIKLIHASVGSTSPNLNNNTYANNYSDY